MNTINDALSLVYGFGTRDIEPVLEAIQQFTVLDYFEIQHTRIGTDNWRDTGQCFVNIQAANKGKDSARGVGFSFRIVRKRVIEEIME